MHSSQGTLIRADVEKLAPTCIWICQCLGSMAQDESAMLKPLMVHFCLCSDKEAALTDLLGVRNVYFWSSKQHQKEMFVKWAAKILEHR